ncbi:hypothetical protein SAMN06296386_105184 [Lachnospiraceae bacterium]|nr:hypothetical protein SAMN06296386_105184 [Lachnospiraceae bacterium]
MPDNGFTYSATVLRCVRTAVIFGVFTYIWHQPFITPPETSVSENTVSEGDSAQLLAKISENSSKNASHGTNTLVMTEIRNVSEENNMDPQQVGMIYELFVSSDDERSDKTLQTIASEIKELALTRHTFNKKSDNVYYNSLNADTQGTIDFYEAILLHIGESEKKINSFKNIYEKILTDKEANENVIELKENEPVIRKKFQKILREAKITSHRALKTLAVLFSHDQVLFKNDNIDKLTDAYVYPYEIGLTTRENMMTAAMSLVGDVRYVWGGGHSGASYIKGINPVWNQFENLYPSEPYENGTESHNGIKTEGFGTCIKPSGSWCPIHGYVSTSFHGETIYSLQQYIDLRSELFDKIDLTDEKYRDMLSTVDYSNGVNAHILDGLDCSGYASWLYNQIQDDYKVNTAARYFTKQSCFKPLYMGENLLPGDLFAWKTHIVVIVGRVREGSKAYVTLEETPNVLRFGVAYYTGASVEDVTYGKQIASEANSLIGGLNPEYERPHVYCINTIGTSASSVTTATPANVHARPNLRLRAELVLAEETAEDIAAKAYSSSYDTLVDDVPYRVYRVFMPRGYPGTAQDIGAPAEGTYEYKTIDEQEEGFYGTYYVKIDTAAEEGTGDPSEGEATEGAAAQSGKKTGQAAHSSDEMVDGLFVRHVFMPYGYEGTLADLGVPDDSIVDHKEVTETKDGFYGTYYIRPEKVPGGWEIESQDEEEKAKGSSEDNSKGEDSVLRLARYKHGFQDEGVALADTGLPIEEMDAVDIIRHTLKKLPISMIDGYNTYDGELFSTFSLND